MSGGNASGKQPMSACSKQPGEQNKGEKVDKPELIRKLITQQLAKFVSAAIKEQDSTLTKRKCREALATIFGESCMAEYKSHLSDEVGRLVSHCQSMSSEALGEFAEACHAVTEVEVKAIDDHFCVHDTADDLEEEAEAVSMEEMKMIELAYHQAEGRLQQTSQPSKAKGKEVEEQRKKSRITAKMSNEPTLELATDDFTAALAAVPAEDWCRTWAADRTIMLRMTSKIVKALVDKVRPPAVLRWSKSFLDNKGNGTADGIPADSEDKMQRVLQECWRCDNSTLTVQAGRWLTSILATITLEQPGQ